MVQKKPPGNEEKNEGDVENEWEALPFPELAAEPRDSAATWVEKKVSQK